MKFLFVAPRFHSNQAAIIRGLKEAGHEILYLVQRIGFSEDHASVVPVRIKQSRLSKIDFRILDKQYSPTKAEDKKIHRFVPSFLHLFLQVRRFRPDYVSLRNKSITTLFVCLICKLLGIKKILLYDQIPVLSDTPAARQSGLRRLIIHVFPEYRYTPVKYAAYPVEGTEYVQDKKAVFIPFVAERVVETRQYCPGGIVRVLAVGKYRDIKNHTLLLDALNGMRAFLPRLQVTFIGQAVHDDEKVYLASLKSYALKLGLSQTVTMRTHVSHTEISGVYAAHDIFVLTTKQEQASIAFVEAMSNGLAVISTNRNGTASYIEDGKNGFVFKSCCSNDLAARLTQYLNHPALIREHGTAARKVADDVLDFEKFYDRFMKAFDKAKQPADGSVVT